MAAQMILGNMDWPRQNIKFWRYRGSPREGRHLDGRWHMVMGDSDLGYGAQAGPDGDLMVQVRESDAPAARLFRALMRDQQYRSRFVDIAGQLITGPLSTARSIAVLESMLERMRPEMERHTARWRKPVDLAAWMQEVDVVRHYARERPAHIKAQLSRFNPK
jgi:hypothetical protein